MPVPTRRLRRWGIAGFTLIEVMVAVAIVAIALVPLFRLHLLSLDATIWTRDYTTAVMLAQSKMASIKLEPGEETGGYEEPAYSRFQWQTVVGEKEELVLGEQDEGASNDSAQPIGVQRIEVVITWQDGGRIRTYKLESYAVDYTVE